MGDAFVTQVQLSVAAARENPARFARTDRGWQYIRVARFPYIVLFEVQDEQILFLGALHTARSMKKWREQRLD
ncbi:MAG: hypothetical protein KDA42_05700 [Planctomycetales bacterium]|nr:hypothetical protein [Planctomycetales bacterium]